MTDALQNLGEAFKRLTTRQKVQIALALAATAGLIWGISLYATQVRYGVLFSQVAQEDAAAVVAALKERNVAHRISASGSVIEVPVEQIDTLRMELAGENLPRGGGVGFEIFDKPSFGLSDFVQNVNYRRALERELGRTIQSLDSVRSARVHLALPPQSVFADEQREASASVVVRLARGSLPPNEVRAITHLVASGVEDLEPSRVSLIDGNGKMLSEGSADGLSGESLSASQLERKQMLEHNVESTLISILEPIVGAGRARVSATVELNATRVQRVEETFDPASAVVRSEVKARSRNPGSDPGGVPGTASNLPGGAAVDVAAAAPGQESQTSTTNFEINKTISTIAEPVGGMVRQSVAVVVDHTTDVDEEGNEVNVPRTAEEMRKIKDIVRAAAGIDLQRGDELIVENIPFEGPAGPVEPEPGIDWAHLATRIARYGALPLAVLLIALLVIRPGIAALRSVRGESTPGSIPTVAELQARIAQGGTLPQSGGAGLRQKLIQAASDDPEAAALVLRGWIKNTGGK